MQNKRCNLTDYLVVPTVLACLAAIPASALTTDVIRATESFTVGTDSTAGGNAAVAQGSDTIASGDYSHAEGKSTTASGVWSHSEGYETWAKGNASHAAGENAEATHDNTYVWSDGTAVGTSTNKQFVVHAENGIWLLGGPISGDGSGLTGLTDSQIPNDLTLAGITPHSGYLDIEEGSLRLWEDTAAIFLPWSSFIQFNNDPDRIIADESEHNNRFRIGTSGLDLYLQAPTVTATGSITATSFIGDGSGLTNLPAPVIATGSIGTTEIADDAITSEKLADNLKVGKSLAVGNFVNADDGSIAAGGYGVGASRTSIAVGGYGVSASRGSLAVGPVYVVASGYSSQAEGAYVTASGDYSHAAGKSASATHDNTYVWSDGTAIASTANKQYTVRAGNGMRVITDGAGLTVDGLQVASLTYIPPQGDLSMGSYTNGLPR